MMMRSVDLGLGELLSLSLLYLSEEEKGQPKVSTIRLLKGRADEHWRMQENTTGNGNGNGNNRKQ